MNLLKLRGINSHSQIVTFSNLKNQTKIDILRGLSPPNFDTKNPPIDKWRNEVIAILDTVFEKFDKKRKR